MGDRYLANARRVLERAERGQGLARIDRPCSHCKFYGGGLFGLAVRPVCNNPVVKLAASQVADVSSAKWLIECEEQRSSSSVFGEVVCGPDASLFEPS